MNFYADKFFWDVRYEEELYDSVFAYADGRNDLIVPYFYWSRPENPIFTRAVELAMVSVSSTFFTYLTAVTRNRLNMV